MAFLDMGDDLVVEELPAVVRAVEIDDSEAPPVTEASATLDTSVMLETPAGDRMALDESGLLALEVAITEKVYDEVEVEAAEMRKDFDAIDVPEVTAPGLPAAIVEVMADMPSDIQKSIARALRYESLKPGRLIRILTDAKTRTERIIALQSLVSELDEDDVPAAPGIVVDMSDAETKAASS